MKSASVPPPPPLLPGRRPLVGHTPAVLRRRWDFMTAARATGPAVGIRLGTKTVYLLGDGELVYDLMTRRAAMVERSLMFTAAKATMGEALPLIEGREHLRRRRAIQPQFQRGRILSYVDQLRATIEAHTAEWSDGRLLDADHAMEELVLAWNAQLLFGSAEAEAATAAMRSSLQDFSDGIALRAALPSWLRWLPTPGKRRFERASRTLRTSISRVKDSSALDPDGLLAQIVGIEGPDGEPALTPQEVSDEIIGLLIAGVETSRVSGSWLLESVARHPDARARLHEELDEVLQGRPVTADDIPRLQYTRQIVSENLRLHALWIVTRRAVADLDFDGMRIPAGSTLLLSAHAMHRDPRHFPEPERFDPSRWDPGRSLPRGAYQPFSSGVHRCLGEHLFTVVAVVLLATLCSRWEFELPLGHEVRLRMNGSIPATGPLPLTLRRREAVRPHQPAAEEARP